MLADIKGPHLDIFWGGNNLSHGSDLELPQHNEAMLNILVTGLAPSMHAFFAAATYICSCSLIYLCVSWLRRCVCDLYFVVLM